MKRHATWRRWVGTQGELGDAIEEAIAGVSKRTGAQARSSVEIVVPPYTFDHESTKDLSELSRRDLNHVSSITARITGDDLAVSIRVVRDTVSPAVTLEVDGADRTVVDGLTDHISRVLDRGRPLVPWLDHGRAMLIGIVIGVALAVGFGSLFARHKVIKGHSHLDAPLWVIAPAVAIGLGVPVTNSVRVHACGIAA